MFLINFILLFFKDASTILIASSISSCTTIVIYSLSFFIKFLNTSIVLDKYSTLLIIVLQESLKILSDSIPYSFCTCIPDDAVEITDNGCLH